MRTLDEIADEVEMQWCMQQDEGASKVLADEIREYAAKPNELNLLRKWLDRHIGRCEIEMATSGGYDMGYSVTLYIREADGKECTGLQTTLDAAIIDALDQFSRFGRGEA